MFTDIEGSTRLLKQLGRTRYRYLLADHERLLRETFLRHRGEVVGTEGDSFFVAFRSATDAVAAAVAIQRTLAGWTWPDGVDLRVRVGVHSGEAEATAESYLGLSVHRAARIGSAAHGGQMLLSSATRELVEDDLPQGLCLLDLGQVRLKDLDRPERISQIAGEGLQRDFPALRGAERIASPSLRGRSLLLATLAGVVAAAVAIPVFALGGSSKPDKGARQSLSEQVARPVRRIIVRQKIVNASLGSLASTLASFARMQKAADGLRSEVLRAEGLAGGLRATTHADQATLRALDAALAAHQAYAERLTALSVNLNNGQARAAIAASQKVAADYTRLAGASGLPVVPFNPRDHAHLLSLVRQTLLGKLGVTYDIVAHSSNGVRYRYAPRLADGVSANGPQSGDRVRIYCYTTGDSVFGNSSWAKVAENPDRYVPAYYLRYGHAVRPAGVKACPPTPVGNMPGPSGLLYRVTGTVTIYSGPTAASSPLGQSPKETRIGVQCKSSGPTVYGPYPPSSNWDRVSFDGVTGFVTDEWVDTKTDEHDPTKVPSC